MWISVLLDSINDIVEFQYFWYILNTLDYINGNQVNEMAKTPKVYSTEECSQEFADAFVRSGGDSVDCAACGRTHFHNTKAHDWDEGEYEDLLAHHATDPDCFIPHDDDDIRWGYIMGMQVVHNCPCGFDAHIEQLLWNDRHWLVEYIKERAENEKRAADNMIANANAAHVAVTS